MRTRILRIARFAGNRLKTVLNNAAALAVLGLIAWQIGPWIDSFFPVVSDAHLIAVVPAEDGTITFRYTFMKHRDCQLVQPTWFYQDGDVIGQADITRAGFTPSRPVGLNASVWWKIGAGEKIPGTFFVENTYNCRWPWTSINRLGPFKIERKAFP